ncbi:hypothetical protein OFK41_13610 [Acinetobacter baumannii]|uniref:hypothetical protein n=1 Tax=Acinetobacter baumannii TaxID=470 RepID=UPI00124A16AB|nr:hypothetical protein [Acinetobacter baumannii]KAB1664940.1 hypothetical protein F8B05_19960 [Acinetobacter baumannii]MCX3035240.1 hypothetical protein [Acinetobacter baumannii]
MSADLNTENTQEPNLLNQEVINKATNWLLNFDSGSSSKIILATILSKGEVKRIGAFETHPTCASDFARCLKLFECVPELKPYFYLMREVSPTWSKFVDKWEEIEATYISEIEADTGFTTETSRMIMQIED